MKHWKFFLLAFVTYTTILLSMSSFISRKRTNTALNEQDIIHRFEIAQIRDSLEQEQLKRINSQELNDSLREAIKILPDSASYKKLEMRILETQEALELEEKDNIRLVKKIRTITRTANKKIQYEPKYDETKRLLERFLEEERGALSRSGYNQNTQPDIHVHIHNHTTPVNQGGNSEYNGGMEYSRQHKADKDPREAFNAKYGSSQRDQ